MTQKWFVETDNDELRYSYALNKTLHATKSKFQDIKVVETAAYGKMLILDDFVMLTEKDEFVYHELLAHIPMLYHPDPRNIAIIGGGDGGTVREILKHPCVESVTLCEIDDQVVSVCKEFFPSVSQGLDDPRVDVFIGDGINFVNQQHSKFDLVLVDSTDPVGPGEGLFTSDFYKNLAKALKPEGLAAAQTESPWAEQKLLQRIYSNMKSGFEHVQPYCAPIPTYPRGFWSWSLASNNGSLKLDSKRLGAIKNSFRYLTPKHVENIFDIPPFYRDKLQVSSS